MKLIDIESQLKHAAIIQTRAKEALAKLKENPQAHVNLNHVRAIIRELDVNDVAWSASIDSPNGYFTIYIGGAECNNPALTCAILKLMGEDVPGSKVVINFED